MFPFRDLDGVVETGQSTAAAGEFLDFLRVADDRISTPAVRVNNQGRRIFKGSRIKPSLGENLGQNPGHGVFQRLCQQLTTVGVGMSAGAVAVFSGKEDDFLGRLVGFRGDRVAI